MTLNTKTVIKILLLLFTALPFEACNRVSKAPQYTIGFSQCVGSDLWRRTMLQEMEMELSFHPDVKFIYADANNNSKKQISQVQEMVKQGVDILIISPNEAQPLTGVVEQTYNKGIPVIVIDRKTSSSLYTAYVGADNYQVGKLAAGYFALTLNGKGRLIEITGLQGSSPAMERDRGFNERLKSFPGIHIINEVHSDWMTANTEKQLLGMSWQLKETDGIFAQNDVMASGSRDVLNRLAITKRIKIIGVDALPGAGGGLQSVASKAIFASILYPTGGKEAITTAFKILNKDYFQKENILQSLVIDSTNVNLMNLQWARISSQQADIERQRALLEEQRGIYNSQQIILNVIIISLVLAVVFGGLAFYSLMENRKINRSLEAKNNEILLQRNQLIEMSARAEAATEAKLNFFTNISHEFRTPLTLILSPVEDMMQNDKVSALEGHGLKLIHKNIFRLLRLVNQLIDYRKIEYDKQQVHASCNNIVDYLKDIVNTFIPAAQKKNIGISITSPRPDISLWFDVDMLDKVFFNLISNALKFTKDNGRIEVIFNLADDTLLEIKINDNGVGMDPEDLEHLFDQFYQAGRNSVSGSGLGLSLSKEIIELHKGTIIAASKKWQGTTFNIRLPYGTAHLQIHEQSTHSPGFSRIPERAMYYTNDLLEEKLPATHAVFSNPKEQSILIIEDDCDLLNYLDTKLASQYEIFTSDSGLNGLTEAFERVPDLIISDVMLPGISGKAISEHLKMDLRTSHIPVILLTAQVSVEQQIQGIRSMADAYIVKPFNYEHLLATIKNLLRNRIILKEHFISDISISGKATVSKGLDKKFLNDFAGIVEHNLANEHFNVDDISKAIGISRVQLYRKVKALMDCSITDYILNRRLKKAKYLLINESYSISEITYMVGFSSPKYFATVFKTKYNCTPSEYKKNHQLS